MIKVFGSINVDLVVAVPRLPVAGETVAGPDHQTFAGGKGANQALAARRAGADVSLVGAVGRDAFADIALTGLKQADVDLSEIRFLDGATGLALIGVDPNGENQIMVASGANGRVEAEWLAGTLSKRDALMLQGELPAGETTKALALAKEAGSHVVWNPAPVLTDGLADMLHAVDTLVVNEGEAAEIASVLGVSADPERFVDALTTDNRSVIVTLGSAGVLAGKGPHGYRMPAPVIDVVDTTGAGDAFCGALAAALDQNVPFERALKNGIAAGSLACSLTGAQSSAPTKPDIDRLADQIF